MLDNPSFGDSGYVQNVPADNPPPQTEQQALAQIAAQLTGISRLLTKVRREVNWRTFTILAGTAQAPQGLIGERCYLDLLHNPGTVALALTLGDGAATSGQSKINLTLGPGAIQNLGPFGVEFTHNITLLAITAGGVALLCGRIRW